MYFFYCCKTLILFIQDLKQKTNIFTMSRVKKSNQNILKLLYNTYNKNKLFRLLNFIFEN